MVKSTFVPEAPAAKHDTPHPVRGVDHCFLLVRDLDSSLEQYRRLGFTVSPRGLHSATKGTANHTIMLSDNDYFELLGVVADTPENAPRRALLASGGEGLYAVACRIEDAYVAKVGLAARGIATIATQRRIDCEIFYLPFAVRLGWRHFDLVGSTRRCRQLARHDGKQDNRGQPSNNIFHLAIIKAFSGNL